MDSPLHRLHPDDHAAHRLVGEVGRVPLDADHDLPWPV
jgi:hypothetical protein